MKNIFPTLLLLLLPLMAEAETIKTDRLHRGLNIIRMSDGTFRKLFVK